MRQIICLDGLWDFVADLDPKYHNDSRIHPVSPYSRPEANRQHWLRVPVPGVWQKYAMRYDIYEGVCWLARDFDAPEIPQGAEARLRFGAVNYLAHVYLNGQWVGSHEGGYTEFALDVTAQLKPGRNHLAVMVDNRATTIKWPPVLGYFNYGGIHRSVSLDIIDGPWLENVKITAVPDVLGGRLVAQVAVRHAQPGLKVRVESEGLGWEELVGEDGSLGCEVPFPGIEPWTPENPVLAPLRLALVNEWNELIDEWTGHCGFRSLALRDGQVELNDRPLALKGICYVYDSPVTGLVMTPEQVETDLRLIKQAGCNVVRCHYPMDPLFYDGCDRLGLLVWIEPPVYCYHPGDQETGTRFADPEWLALAQQMAREMIAVARNHPSVAIYSIGNECNTHNPEAEPFFRTLAATIREEDPTRLLSYAALYGNIGPIADMVDVLGINSYYGWYDQITQDGSDQIQEVQVGEGQVEAGMVPKRSIDLAGMRAMIEAVISAKPEQALLLTEFGADSTPGAHSRSRDPWSEEYHADLLAAIFALAQEYPQIVGTFPFCFSDYRDPSKPLNGHWNEFNLKGIVTYTRRQKLAFRAVQQAYRV